MTQIQKVFEYAPIRLLCLSDTHGDLPEVQPEGKFHAILHAGDIDSPKSLRRLERMARKVWTPLFYVLGNNDNPKMYAESSNDVSGRAIRIADDLLVAGVGFALGEGCLPSEEELAKACADTVAATRAVIRKGDRVILLTHYPPALKGTEAYASTASGVFSPSVGAVVKELKPLSVVHGHLHDLQGHSETWKGTLIACAGPEWSLLTVDVAQGKAQFSPWVVPDERRC